MTSTEIFNEACEHLGYNSKTIISDYAQYPEHHQRSKKAFDKIEIIIESKNRKTNNDKTWIPNYKDINEYKWEPWFYMGGKEGSSGFRLRVYGRWAAHSYVGSRLCYITEELGNEVIPQIIDLYKDAYMW